MMKKNDLSMSISWLRKSNYQKQILLLENQERAKRKTNMTHLKESQSTQRLILLSFLSLLLFVYTLTLLSGFGLNHSWTAPHLRLTVETLSKISQFLISWIEFLTRTQNQRTNWPNSPTKGLQLQLTTKNLWTNTILRGAKGQINWGQKRNSCTNTSKR